MIKERIESDRRLVSCSVIGEISNFKHHSSGHIYLTLKDDKSRLRAVMFASRARALRFRPEDGMRVIATGNVGVFERDGQVQLYVDDMQPDGIGALYIAFTQLKDRLQREGLFDEKRKRPLPSYPARIGVVTSPTGAVIRDISSTLSRRYPLAKVVLAPAKVQGPGAAQTIVEGIRRLEKHSKTVEPIDVIIIARGGGSLEELWPFNEEILARAIALSSLPIISGVGHETDFTIADFVADLRAATPTAAAEVVAPSFSELYAYLGQMSNRSRMSLGNSLYSHKSRLEALTRSSVLRAPMNIVDVPRQHVDYLENRLTHVATRPIYLMRQNLGNWGRRVIQTDPRRSMERLRGKLDYMQQGLRNDMATLQRDRSHHLEQLTVRLEGLNPLQLLRRGYSVVSNQVTGKAVTSVHQVENGTPLAVHVSDGLLLARVYSKTSQEENDDGRYQQGKLDL